MNNLPLFYVNRPKIVEEIRKSILNNKTTNIYGSPGIGKTTICNFCLDEYFHDINQIKMILSKNNMLFHLDKERPYIYVFDNYENFSLNENIIKFINSSSSNIKFIFISRNRVNQLKNINTIKIPPFTNKEIHELIQKKYHYEENIYNIDILQQKIIKISKRNPSFINLIIEYISANGILNVDTLKTIYKPCIVDQYGKPIEKIDNSTQIIVAEVNDELLCELSKKPELLHSLSAYDFERVIARIFEKQGFSVEITARTHDGGKDIFIAKKGLASFLFYVECKKYAPNKPVGIDVIQRLYGVISAEKATGVSQRLCKPPN